MTARTLFEMAGARVEPARLPAPLVVIDAQNDYLDGLLPLVGMAVAVAVLARLLAAARAVGGPVVHVAHRGAAGRLLDRAGRGGDFIAGLAPLTGEAVVEKTFANAFAGTDLAAHLPAGGPLILAGFMTHNCVSSTARAAVERGFLPTIVTDATATRDLADGFGGVIPAAEAQRAELAALADRHAVLARAGDLIGA